MGESVETSPWLSLWESCLGKAETERANVEDLGGRDYSTNAARPSQSPLVTALPRGEPRSAFRYVFPLRLLFLQSTAYGGPPSPKGKVLVLSLHAGPVNQSPKRTVQELPLGEAGSLSEPDEGSGAA